MGDGMQDQLQHNALPAHARQDAAFTWAVQHQTPLVLSVRAGDNWVAVKSAFVGFDPAQRAIQVLYPQAGDQPAVEIVAGQQVGVSFRRGHKKCIFSTIVVMRRNEPAAAGVALDTLILRCPEQLQEMQRRAYERITCPPDRFIAVRLWEGLGAGHDGSWPLCSGRVANVSMGGVQVDIRQDHNPRLSIGDRVGVEITVSPGRPPLMLDAQYRHCAISSPGRLGLGFQFLGLEHSQPNRATLAEISEFVKEMQRAARRMGHTGDGCGDDA